MPKVEWSFLLPAEDHKQVKHLLTYCQSRLTPWGSMIFLITLPGLAVSSVGTQIAAYFLPSFILALLIVSYFLSLFFRPRVDVQRILPAKITAGGHCRYNVIVKNTGKRPIRNLAIYEQTLPYGLYAAPDHPAFQNTADWLLPGEQRSLTLVMRTPRRGTFELRPLVAGSSFPSGILRSRVKAGGKAKMVVYPKFIRQDEFQLFLTRQFQPGGISLSSKVGDSNEFASTREYRLGDRLRDVHWASSARTGKLIVKEYIEEYFVRVGLFVDTELRRFEKHKGIEGRISLCAGIADKLCASDYVVDLFLSDENLSHFQGGRGLENFDHLLELLSAIEGDSKVDFPRSSGRLEEFGRDFSMLIVFLKDWDLKRSRFVSHLQESGIKTRALIIRDRPTTLPVANENVSVYKTSELADVK